MCEKYGALKFCKIHWDKMGRSKVLFLFMAGKFLSNLKETAVVGYFDQLDAEKAVA